MAPVLRHSHAIAAMASDRSEVDATSPFASVKEAVAIFGERFIAGNASSCRSTSSSAKFDAFRSPTYSMPPPKPLFSANSSPPSLPSTCRFVHGRDDDHIVLGSLKKLEAELYATKGELKQLKERQSETKVAVATLCLHLQRSMSRLSEFEAGEGEARITVAIDQENEKPCKAGNGRRRQERIQDCEYLPTLAQALGHQRMEDEFVGRGQMKMPKRKPIIPLIGDIFPKRKGSSDLGGSVYSPSFFSLLS